MSNVSLKNYGDNIANQVPPADSYAWSTVKTVVLGDFYKDPTLLGLGIRAGLGCVPVVGQILDLADTAAWVCLCYERGLPPDWEVLTNGVILFVGYVPAVGDVLRTIMKVVTTNIVRRGADLLPFISFVVKGNGADLLKKLVGDWDINADKAIKIAKDTINKLSELIGKLSQGIEDYANELAQKGGWRKWIYSSFRDEVEYILGAIDDYDKFMRRLGQQVEDAFRAVFREIGEKFRKLVGDLDEVTVPVGSKGTASKLDDAIPPPTGKGHPMSPRTARIGSRALDWTQADDLYKKAYSSTEIYKSADKSLCHENTKRLVEHFRANGVDTSKAKVVYLNSVPDASGEFPGLKPKHPRSAPKHGSWEHHVVLVDERGRVFDLDYAQGTDPITWDEYVNEMFVPPGSSAADALDDVRVREIPADKYADEYDKIYVDPNTELQRQEVREQYEAMGFSDEQIDLKIERDLPQNTRYKDYDFYRGDDAEHLYPSKPLADTLEAPDAPHAQGGAPTAGAVLGSNAEIAARVQHLGDASPGSCKVKTQLAMDEDLVDLNPARYHVEQYPNLHYHLRLEDGRIVDPTYMQFFDVPTDTSKVFVGTQQEMVAELDQMMKTHGLRKGSPLPAKNGQELFDMVWGRTVIDPSMPVPDWATKVPVVDPHFRTPELQGKKHHIKGASATDPEMTNTTGEPVDLVTGSVLAKETDFELPGPLPLRFTRRWDSASAEYVGPLGRGWAHCLDQSLVAQPLRTAVRIADGRTIYFTPLRVGQSDYNRGARATLTRRKKGYTLRDANGWVHAFADVGRFDGALALIGIVDRNENRIELKYEEGFLVEVIDSAGRQLRFVNDEEGFLRGIDVPHPEGSNGEKLRIVSFDYDDEPHLTEVKDALGQPFRYQYDDEHLIVQQTDRNGMSFHWEYDNTGLWPRCTRTWGDGNVLYRELHYDRPNRTTTVIDGAGHKWVYQGHHIGMVQLMIDPLGNETRYDYDDDGNLLSVTNPKGETTRYEHDGHGRLTAVISPLGCKRELRYDRLGNPVTLIDEAGNQWQREYDERGNLVGAIEPTGARWTYSYDARGQLTSVVDPAGGEIRLERDIRGQIVRSIGRDGAVTELSYDAAGRVVERRDAEGGITRMAWNELGQLAARTDAAGRTWRFDYDAQGLLARATAPSGKSHHFTYGPLGALERATTPGGATTHYRYDQELRLARVKDPAGRRWIFERDALGLISSETGFDGRHIALSYDPAGRLASRRDGNGKITRFGYDAAGRLARKDLADGASERFEYDALDRLIAAENDAARVTFDYDAVGNLVGQSHGDETIRCEFDAVGNRTRRISPFGRELQFDYDPAQRLKRLADGRGELLRFSHDRLGREVERRGPGALRLERSYGATGELLDTRAFGPTGDLLTARDYRYDDAGRLSRTTDEIFGTTDFRYDLDSRLEEAIYPDRAVQRFAFDEAGNAPGVPCRGEGGQAVRRTQVGDWRLRWDEDGNLLEKKGRELHYTFEYDGAGRLKQVVRDVRVPASRHTKRRASDPARREVITFAYDALGRRVKKRRTRPDGEFERTHFFWDGDALLGERREQGDASSTVEYVFADKRFAPLAQFETQGAYFLECDQIDAPRAAFDSEGRLVWQADYGAYGALREERGHAGLTPLRLPGQYADAETDLHYSLYRYYDPELRLFTSPDPLGLAATTNLHNYPTDPLSVVDPYGLTCMEQTPETPDTPTPKAPTMADPNRTATLGLGDSLLEFSAGRGVPWQNWTGNLTRRSTAGTNFGRSLTDTLRNADAIKFNLDGITDLKGTFNAGRSGFQYMDDGLGGILPGNATNTEFTTVLRNPEFLEKTTFYRGGRPVATETVLKEVYGQ